MRAFTVFVVFVFLVIGSEVASGQGKGKASGAAAPTVQIAATPSHIAASPAYAEILLRKTELQSELEAMLAEYTEDFPKVREARYSLQILQRESDRIMNVKPADAGKLTLALGKLIVRKVELETELWSLLKTYKEEHPDVKRARRKVEIYDAAIKEILG